MTLFFTHPATHEPSHFPWGRDSARKNRRTRYRSESPCIHCGAPQPVRYTRGDACQGCTLLEVSKIQRWAADGAEGECLLHTLRLHPTNEKPSVHCGRRPCTSGPHFHVAAPDSKECLNCEIERNETPSSRETARDAGEKTYDPGAPCVRGHDALRYVANGGCLECMHPGKTDKPRGRTNADARRDASALGLKTFDPVAPCVRGHTAQRSVANGGCLQCANPQRKPAMTLDETIACLELVRSAPDMVMPRSDAAALGMGVFREDGQAWRYVSGGALVQP